MSNLKLLLLAAPDGQLDTSLHPLIEKWDDGDPTSLQVLELLDNIVFFAGASNFVIGVLNQYLQGLLIEEKKTYDQIANIADATWRLQAPFVYS